MYGISDHRCTVFLTTDRRYSETPDPRPDANTVLPSPVQETTFQRRAATQTGGSPSLRHSSHDTLLAQNRSRPANSVTGPAAAHSTFCLPNGTHGTLTYRDTVPRVFLLGQDAFSTARGSGLGRCGVFPAGGRPFLAVGESAICSHDYG